MGAFFAGNLFQRKTFRVSQPHADAVCGDRVRPTSTGHVTD